MIKRATFFTAFFSVVLAGCGGSSGSNGAKPPVSLKEVPSQRLSYRFEADVPPPEMKLTPAMVRQRNEAVLKDFDENRPQEILDRTIESPDKKSIAAVYRMISDEEAQYRLDIYSPDGKLVRKVTHEEMAVHFPDTIVWSPDSKHLAFVAMVRTSEGMVPAEADPLKGRGPEELKGGTVDSGANSNSNGNSADAEGGSEAQKVITFRTEQIYLCNADGSDLKALTKNEGLVFFYFVWSPDSSALATLTTTITEWRLKQRGMQNAGRAFVPEGRPRLVEINGRERLLDDYPTEVRPVWSPDSAKVAVAFDRQIRIYDAIGDHPTQAAIPLQNELLLASKKWEEAKKAADGPDALATPASNSNGGSPTPNRAANSNSNVRTPSSALPDPGSLVSYNPIVALEWPKESTIYFQTALVKNYLDSSDNISSFARWHRLVLSPQAAALKKEQK